MRGMERFGALEEKEKINVRGNPDCFPVQAKNMAAGSLENSIPSVKVHAEPERATRSHAAR